MRLMIQNKGTENRRDATASGPASARRGLVQDFRELVRLDLVELFLAGFQLLESLHDRLGHAPVGLFRTADDRELLARGDAFVAVVVVEPEAEQGGLRRLARGWFSFSSRSHAVPCP